MSLWQKRLTVIVVLVGLGLLAAVGGKRTLMEEDAGVYTALRALPSPGLNDTTLSAAVAAIAGAKRALVVTPGTWNIFNDLVIPANIQLRVVPGAILNITAGKTLTINGDLDAPNQQWIVGTNVIFGKAVLETSPIWWGAVCDGVASDHAAIQAALNSAGASGNKVVRLPAATCWSNTAQITIPDGTSVVGNNWNSSILRLVGAVKGFVYNSANTDLPTVRFENFSVLGDPASSLDLFTVSGGAWNVDMHRVRLRGTQTNALVLDQVPGFTFCNGEIGAFAQRGIWTRGWANGVVICGTRFEDFGTVGLQGAISISSAVASGVWHIKNNLFESNTNQSHHVLFLDNAYLIRFEENYIERYLDYLVKNGTTGALSNITIHNNYMHSNYPFKINLAEGALVHKNIRITENSFAGVSAPSQIFLPGSADPFEFCQNASDFATPSAWVAGYPTTETCVRKGRMIHNGPVMIGDWNHVIQHETSPTDAIRIENAVDLSKIRMIVGATEAAVVEEDRSTFAGAVTAGTRTFTTLFTPGNGSLVYCSDCNNGGTVGGGCTSGGTGKMAMRINAQWLCY